MLLRSLLGKVAIANAKLAYQRYGELFSGERWQALVDRGAQTQRLLWASTGVKNPAYSDVMYLDELIGPDTVNTVPPATLDAFRDHGCPKASLETDLEAAQDVLDSLNRVGVSLNDVTDRLLQDGLQIFVDAFVKLLGAVQTARESTVGTLLNRQQYRLPSELEEQVDATLEEWQNNDKVRRLWARDASLWSGTDEAQWLDWLDITREQVKHLGKLYGIVQEVEGKFFRHAVLLGMGGSSLAPEVMRLTFGTFENHPELLVLDSTDPAQVKAIEDQIDYTRTVFIVSSKSGSTLEPNIFKQYFFTRASEALGGAAKAARHFAAITDPGSKMQHVAEGDGFRRVFFGKPGIGGRYSALSNFGMVPAAATGVDLDRFLDMTEEMVQACAACVPARDNPGVVLGAILGAAGNAGRDKITIVASPGIASLGAWLEQLLADSTGKDGKGLIPVDGEQLAVPELYGNDRLFAYLRLVKAPDAEQDAAIERLEQAGQPVVRISVKDIYNLGQEFYRWEIATATAGSILGINAFNQPDVEASKLATRKLTTEYEENGQLPEESPFAEGDGLKLYADHRNVAALKAIAGDSASVGDYLNAHLKQLGPGDYFALLAYLERNDAHQGELQEMRHGVRDAYKVATCLGFGPRFLHSTGQAYKGGPNSGVFLQITCDDAADLPVPDQKYSFGVVKAAQARGDFQVLAERGRRALRIHMGPDTMAGLARLRELLAAACND
jgi:transaldolase/glucose-6-phosphate isomerase